jgi:hypothetical protein
MVGIPDIGSPNTFGNSAARSLTALTEIRVLQMVGFKAGQL